MLPFVRSQFLCLVILFLYGNVSFFLLFSTKMTQSHIQGSKFIYVCVCVFVRARVCVWQYLLFVCLINFDNKSHLFERVTYVTAMLSTYIPYMIHQSYHHLPRTYIDSN